MIDLLIQNIEIVVTLIIALIVLGAYCYSFITQPSDKRKARIKKVALSLVFMAEKEFASKTGKLKLAYVYTELITRLPYLRYVPLSVVEKLIEDALVEMKTILNDITVGE